MARILIAIDQKWRDLPGHVYAGAMLEQLGHEVKYVRNNLEKHYARVAKPDLVLLNHLTPVKKQNFARYLKSHGVKVAILPTEGIPTLEKMRPSFVGGPDCDLGAVDLHFVWNQPMADILQENPTIREGVIQKIGSPRFDFYREPLLLSLPSRQDFLNKYKLDPNLPVVTFATNFTQASFYTANQDFFEKNARSYKRDAAFEAMFGNHREVPRKDHLSRAIFTDGFLKLVEHFPNVNFILKLHPSEDHQFYQCIIQDKIPSAASRVKIISSEYIWDVIVVSDVLMSRSCTTALESWFLGKPTIEMQLNPDDWYFSPEHASGSDMVSNVTELKKKLAFYLSGGEIAPHLVAARERFIQRWCFKVDGFSTLRMVERLHDLVSVCGSEKKLRNKLPFNLKSSFYGVALTAADYLIHDVRVYGMKNVAQRNYVDKLGRFDKYFHARDVGFWRGRLKNIAESAMANRC